VKDANPDVLYLPDYYSTVNLQAAQAREMGITATLMGGDGWDSADLDREATDGGFHTNHYSSDDPRPVVQEWVKKYQDKYGSPPDALATLAYDAAYMLLQGIEEAGKADPAAVAKAMEGLEYNVVSGQSHFDEFHNPVKPAVILEIKDGKTVYRATVSP